MYPSMDGVYDPLIQSEVFLFPLYFIKQVVKLADITLPITVTARNVDFEFYWEDKCKKQLKNCKREDHGLSYKQAFIERHIQKLLENHKAEASVEELKKELEAARYEIFCLRIS